MLFFKMQNYINYLNYKKIIYFIPEIVDFLFPKLWTFHSRTYGHFIPENVDISFPILSRARFASILLNRNYQKLTRNYHKYFFKTAISINIF